MDLQSPERKNSLYVVMRGSHCYSHVTFEFQQAVRDDPPDTYDWNQQSICSNLHADGRSGENKVIMNAATFEAIISVA